MCQLFGANMTVGFWPYAIETTTYLVNRSPTMALTGKTLFEAWTGERPNIKNLHTFGEMGYVHIPPETRKKWTQKARPCHFLGYMPRSRNYKLWDPERRCVVESPNVDFDESSATRASTKHDWDLHDLKEALDMHDKSRAAGMPDTELAMEIGGGYGSASEWESDTKILQPRATKDEVVPNGPDPVAPPIPREPDTPIRRRCSEVERLADAAGPPPAMERRRPRAAVGTVSDIPKAVGDHRASVGVVEIGEKDVSKARKYAYCEALLVAENTHLHNELIDVNKAKRRPDWPKWKAAMQEELDSLDQHGTYEQVSKLPIGRRAVGYKWVFKLKLNPDNSIARYKARLVAKGYSQVPSQDFTETTSPVAQLASYRALLALATKLNLEAHHLDIETAFLNGTLDEEIYMKAPDRFNTEKNGIWKLRKSLYGLKQASHVWNKLLDGTLKKLGFNRCGKDTCVYLFQSGTKFIILAVHVDDMLIVLNSKSKLAEMKLNLTKHFKVKDLGKVKFLLGIEIIRDRKLGSIDLLQQAYINQLLKRFNLQDANPVTTLLSSSIHLTQDDCPVTEEEKRDMENVPYASLIGALMYAAIGTRPDIAFAVGALSRFLGNPGR